MPLWVRIRIKLASNPAKVARPEESITTAKTEPARPIIFPSFRKLSTPIKLSTGCLLSV